MYITCPYCGTKHLEFQSNCKNCGAPLPGPGELAVDAARRKLAMPPAPPREIASSFAWRWLLTDGWSIAAFVFVIVGGSFSLTGVGLIAGIITAIVGIPLLLIGLVFLGGGVGVFYWRYTEAQKALNVLRHGLATRGGGPSHAISNKGGLRPAALDRPGPAAAGCSCPRRRVCCQAACA